MIHITENRIQLVPGGMFRVGIGLLPSVSQSNRLDSIPF